LVEQRDWPKYEKKKVKPYDEPDLAHLIQFADEDEADVIEFYLAGQEAALRGRFKLR